MLGQSAASKMKDIPLSNDTVEMRISDMAEDTETQLTEKILLLLLLLALQLPMGVVFYSPLAGSSLLAYEVS